MQLRPALPSERELRLGLAEPIAPPPPAEAGPLREPESAPSFWRELAGTFWPFGYAGRRAGFYILALTVAGIATGADFQIFFVLGAQVQAAFGGVQFLLLASLLNSTVTLIVVPAAGYLADRVSRVWLLRFGGLLSAGGLALVGLATSAGSLIGFKLLSTAGSYGISQSVSGPLTADYVVPESRGKAFGLISLGTGLGSIVAPIGIGVVGTLSGWRTAFFAIAAVSLPFVLLYFALREPKRGELDRLAAGAQPAPPEPAVPLRDALRRAARVTTLRRLWLAQVLMSTAGVTNLIAITYYAVTWRLNPAEYGLVIAAGGAATLAVLFFAGPLTEMLMRQPARSMAFLAGLAVLLIGCQVVLWAAPSVFVAAAATAVVTVAITLSTPSYSPVLNALLSLTVPPRIRGFGMNSIAPFAVAGQLLGLVAFSVLGVNLVPYRDQFLPFTVFYLGAAAVYLAATSGVAKDIRTALAAAAAGEATRAARDAGQAKLLVVRGLEMTLGGAQVLFGTDFDVSEGEIVALLGTNGAGKSTLLRAIAGLEPITGGAVFLEDVDVTYLPAHERARAGLAMVGGGRAVFPNLTVRQNLALGGSEPEAVLGLFPALRDRQGTRAGDLSGGEQQMLCLAQALIERPRLLLVDELTLGLAPQVVEELLRALRRARDAGTTIVLVEQSVNLALTIADRAVFMEKGEVRFEGAAADLLRRGDLVRSAFLGASHSGDLSRNRPFEAATEGDFERNGGPVLEARELQVAYGGVTALDGAGVSIRLGEVVGFIGPNGAGKSTLFDCLSGFVRPDGGRVALLGQDVTDLRAEVRAKLGLVRSFQNVRLFPALTVRETIAVAFERHLGRQPAALNALWFPARATERRLARRVDNLVQSLGLGPHQDKFVGELSTGTRRIVDLACLLAAEPKVLLLDEPSSGLAQAETEELGPLIGRIGKETGCAVLVIEHDLALVRSLSQRMYALDRGRVIAEGTPEEVLADDQVVQSYLAGSEAALRRSGLLAGV